jgi:predicted metal-dependent TIM-barrel fold hydrolase
VHVRFRCGDGVYRTFFWAALTIQPDKADAQGIFDVLKGHFEASDVSMSKV